MGTVWPVGDRQLRIWRELTKQDEFYPVYQWPDQIRRLALADRLQNRDRAFLLLFILENGGSPDFASRVIHLGRNFDNAAEQHISWLLKNWTRYEYRYWNLEHNTYCIQRQNGQHLCNVHKDFTG